MVLYIFENHYKYLNIHSHPHLTNVNQQFLNYTVYSPAIVSNGIPSGEVLFKATTYDAYIIRSSPNIFQLA